MKISQALALLLLLTTLLLGWFLLQDRSRSMQTETASVPPSRDKQRIEEARKNRDITALNAFIRTHPDSEWLDTAIFYRDQFAYSEAMAKGDQNSLKRYLQDYPASQWTGFVEQQLEQLQREEEARQARQQRKQLLGGKTDPAQLPIDSAPKISSGDRVNSPAQALVEPPQPRTSLSARERIQRALSIYEKQRAEKEFSEYQQQQRELEKKQQQRNCSRMRRQLAEFKKRFRWYRIDEQGEKIFLNAEEIEQKRQETETYLKRNCH